MHSAVMKVCIKTLYKSLRYRINGNLKFKAKLHKLSNYEILNMNKILDLDRSYCQFKKILPGYDI